jgi:DNA-binding XRE family transcriptional regulator
MIMKIHPQMITKNNLPEFVVLSYKEYEQLLEALEDQEDIEEVNEFHATGGATIPFEILRAITDKGQNAVRAFREWRNISQAALAKKISISRQYLCQIENNQRKGNSRTLKKIATILDVDVALLISDTE